MRTKAALFLFRTSPVSKLLSLKNPVQFLFWFTQKGIADGKFLMIETSDDVVGKLTGFVIESIPLGEVLFIFKLLCNELENIFEFASLE